MKRFILSPIGISCLIAIPALVFSFYISTREPNTELSDSDPQVRRNRSRVIGGVERPISDITKVRVGSGLDKKTAKTAPDNSKVEYQFGQVTCPKVPILSWGQNKQMDSVMEAASSGKYPERLSPIHSARPFDVEAWKSDPKVYQVVGKVDASVKSSNSTKLVAFQEAEANYLDVVEPARIYDVAQPDVDVQLLQSASEPFYMIKDGEAVRVGVKTLPLAPVSLTAFGVGTFDNGLAAITTVADENGIATAVFTTSTGTDTIHILAGSPVTSGNVRFIVKRERLALQPR